MAERDSVPLRDHFKPDCPIVGYWSALGQPTVREVYTTAKEYCGKRVCLEFLEDWAPFHGDDVAFVCFVNGRYLSFHLPVSNSKTDFHRQLYMDYHYESSLQLPPGFEVDHIVDSATLHQRDNTLANLQMLSARDHGLKTARGVADKKKLAEEAARVSAREQVDISVDYSIAHRLSFGNTSFCVVEKCTQRNNITQRRPQGPKPSNIQTSYSHKPLNIYRVLS